LPLTSRHLPRISAAIDQQHQRGQLAQDTVADNRHRLGERQRELVFRHAADGLGEFIAERNRQRHRAAVAAGPAIGVGAELAAASPSARTAPASLRAQSAAPAIWRTRRYRRWSP